MRGNALAAGVLRAPNILDVFAAQGRVGTAAQTRARRGLH
jgi:hypothetical protein